MKNFQEALKKEDVVIGDSGNLVTCSGNIDAFNWDLLDVVHALL